MPRVHFIPSVTLHGGIKVPRRLPEEAGFTGADQSTMLERLSPNLGIQTFAQLNLIRVVLFPPRECDIQQSPFFWALEYLGSLREGYSGVLPAWYLIPTQFILPATCQVNNLLFSMESISRLRSELLTTLSSHGHGEQELFDELMLQKSRLQNLFDVGPSSPQEQRELQIGAFVFILVPSSRKRVFTPGRVTLNGRSLAVNADFAQQAIFLAQQLKCSEKYVASILHSIMAQNPNINSVTAMEATVVEFHKRRRHLVDCLRFLFEAAESAQLPDTPRLYVRLETFLRQELVPTIKLDGRDVSLAYRIFKEIESLGNAVSEACAAKQCATSNTVPPGSGRLQFLWCRVFRLPSYRCSA